MVPENKNSPLHVIGKQNKIGIISDSKVFQGSMGASFFRQAQAKQPSNSSLQPPSLYLQLVDSNEQNDTPLRTLQMAKTTLHTTLIQVLLYSTKNTPYPQGVDQGNGSRLKLFPSIFLITKCHHGLHSIQAILNEHCLVLNHL